MIFSKLSLILGFVLFLFLKQIQAQTPVLFEEKDLYGYKTQRGQIIIKAKYDIATDFKKSGIAYVADAEGWKVINSKGRTLFKPFIYDNAPDDFSNGLARFVHQEKIGFYNEKGEIIIPATWTFAEPFKDKKALVCIGCHKVQDGEHYYHEGGEWFYIDEKGNRIP